MWKKWTSSKWFYVILATVLIAGAVVVLQSVSQPTSQQNLDQDLSQQMYYRMHQSLGFIEMYAKGRCPGGLRKAQGLLAMHYDREKSRELWEILRKMMRLMSSSEKPAISEIEKLREELRTVQLQKNYHHEDAWAQEYENCVLR